MPVYFDAVNSRVVKENMITDMRSSDLKRKSNQLHVNMEENAEYLKSQN